MKILILTPSAYPSVTGNALTVERWRDSLSRRDCSVRVVSMEGNDHNEPARIIREDPPHIIHAHHLIKSGAPLLEEPLAAAVSGIPLVVSPAGTDISRNPSDPPLSETALRVCSAAQGIVTQTPWLFDLLQKALPGLRHKITAVPKAFRWMGNDPFDLRSLFQGHGNDFFFFCPAGVRPVKNNLACLHWIEEVHRVRPRVRVVFAGPALDRDYAEHFEREIRRCAPFARWIEEIPPEAMQSAYASADAVLNGSLSEGLSNTLLESIAAGKPLIASRVPGNLWPVEGDRGDGPCGLLFDLDDPADCVAKTLLLMDKEALRRDLADACRSRAARLPRPEDEASALYGAYGRAAGIAERP